MDPANLPEAWYQALPCDADTFRLCTATTRAIRRECARQGVYRAASGGAPAAGRCAVPFELRGRTVLCPVTLVTYDDDEGLNVNSQYCLRGELDALFEAPGPGLGRSHFDDPTKMCRASLLINVEPFDEADLVVTAIVDGAEVAPPRMRTGAWDDEDGQYESWMELAERLRWTPYEGFTPVSYDNERHALGSSLTIMINEI